MRVTMILAGLALGLVASAAPAGAQTKIKMTYTAVSGFAAGYVAQEQGFFQKHGVDVQFIQTNISGNIPAVIESGSVDVGGPTMPSVLQANDAGLDLVVFAGGAVYPLPGDVLIARDGAGIDEDERSQRQDRRRARHRRAVAHHAAPRSQGEWRRPE